MTIASIRGACALGALVLVAGCAAKPLPDNAAPVSVTPTNPAVIGLDVYGPDREAGANVPAYGGEETVQVRTFHDPEGANNRSEKAGICTIKGGTLFSAEVRTPGKLIVPNYGVTSSTLSAMCEAGNLSGTGAASVYNKTKADIANTGASAGLLGLAVAAVVAEAVSDENDVFKYPDLIVEVQ